MAGSVSAAAYATLLDRVLHDCERSVQDLNDEELNHLPPDTNSIGFDAWHVARTIDNVLFFVFERERPMWLTGGYDERFALPKVAQGTGMTTAEARALRFPEPAVFLEYVRALRAAAFDHQRDQHEKRDHAGGLVIAGGARGEDGDGELYVLTNQTGALGSGKTTLLRHLLRARNNLRVAVLMNELADVDVDSVLLDAAGPGGPLRAEDVLTAEKLAAIAEGQGTAISEGDVVLILSNGAFGGIYEKFRKALQ